MWTTGCENRGGSYELPGDVQDDRDEDRAKQGDDRLTSVREQAHARPHVNLYRRVIGGESWTRRKRSLHFCFVETRGSDAKASSWRKEKTRGPVVRSSRTGSSRRMPKKLPMRRAPRMSRNHYAILF